MNKQYYQEALKLMDALSKDITSSLKIIGRIASRASNYVTQRLTIQRVFDLTSGTSYNSQSIILRLTVIDSFYSTNAAYSYYAIDSMADSIFALGTERAASDYFYSIACGDADTKGLFSKRYGIHKNLSIGNQQLSLMSKYAYYAVLQDTASYPLGFPIYDSLVKKMYPTVSRHLCLKKKALSSISIESYVKALDEVRKTFFVANTKLINGIQQFDVLDAYLWRMGKIDGGNYSLLFDQEDYEKFISNLGLKQTKSNHFDNDVRSNCLTNSTTNIVFGTMKSGLMQYLIDHWKTYFK